MSAALEIVGALTPARPTPEAGEGGAVREVGAEGLPFEEVFARASGEGDVDPDGQAPPRDAGREDAEAPRAEEEGAEAVDARDAGLAGIPVDVEALETALPLAGRDAARDVAPAQGRDGAASADASPRGEDVLPRAFAEARSSETLAREAGAEVEDSEAVRSAAPAERPAEPRAAAARRPAAAEADATARSAPPPATPAPAAPSATRETQPSEAGARAARTAVEAPTGAASQAPPTAPVPPDPRVPRRTPAAVAEARLDASPSPARVRDAGAREARSLRAASAAERVAEDRDAAVRPPPTELPARSVSAPPAPAAPGPGPEAVALGGAWLRPVASAPAAGAAPTPAPVAAEAVPLHVEWLAARGGGAARVHLHPPELGEIQLSVRVRGGAVDVVIRAQEPAAQRLIAEGRLGLVDALAARELRVEQLEVLPAERETGDAGSRGLPDPREGAGDPRRRGPQASPRSAPAPAPAARVEGGAGGTASHASAIDLRV